MQEKLLKNTELESMYAMDSTGLYTGSSGMGKLQDSMKLLRRL